MRATPILEVDREIKRLMKSTEKTGQDLSTDDSDQSEAKQSKDSKERKDE